MFSVSKRALLVVSILALAVLLVIWWPRHAPQVELPKPAPAHLSSLSEEPDWSELDMHQGSMGRSEFEQLIDQVYTTGSLWRDWVDIGDSQVRVRMHGENWYGLSFRNEGREVPSLRTWKRADELGVAPVGRPLQGLHIAIDPGHLGGEWAKMEDRWLVVDGQPPICEGDMTLFVAELLKPRLEGLGAKVTLVRDSAQPVTKWRPSDLVELAKQELGADADPWRVQKVSERLFYRTAEIRARAERVNEEIRPDLVLCLHFNADAWGDPSNPTLVEKNHFHLLVHGAYADEEVALEDQRFMMLKKLLSRVHYEEAPLAESIAEAFVESTEMPPFQYKPGSSIVRPVGDHSCVWARNLLANRLYDCPVIFMEPYVMNSKLDYPRMQAGDYVGLRKVAGKMQPSIFREYAELMISGLVRHYGSRR